MRIDAGLNPEGHAEQDVYLKALIAAGSVDQVEYGEYGEYGVGIRSRSLAVKGTTVKDP